MNEWIFNSIIPYVNKDVIPLENFRGVTVPMKFKCCLCGEEIVKKPEDILWGQTHRTKNHSKWTQYNKAHFSEKSIQTLIKRLETACKHNSKTYLFITPYIDESTEIVIEDKINHIQQKVLLRELERKTISRIGITKKAPHKPDKVQIIKKEKKEKKTKRVKAEKSEKQYKIYDKKNETTFEGGLKDFVEYVGRNTSCKNINELRKRQWFKKNYKILINKKPRSMDANLTYISRKHDGVKCSYCIRRGFLYKSECDICFYDNKYYTKKEFNDILKQNPQIEPINDFINKSTPITFKCKICGFIFEKMPKDILNGLTCSNCSSSKGEQLVSMYLNKHNIEYVKEKTFDDLLEIKKLRFDFYLPKYNAIIEYDGIQHFRPISFFTHNEEEALSKYKQQKNRDKKKNKYCEINNIPLLRIAYNEHNIEDIILNFIQKLKM